MKRKAFYRVNAFVVLFMMLLNVCTYAMVENIPKHTEEFFVNDYANIIDDETEKYICEKGRAYCDSDGTQVVVLTMPSIDGENLEEFSIETAREWGIGSKDESNGVLVLLVLDSRDIRIEVGYGLEGVLNDGKCGRFIRNAKDMLSAGDYSGGLKSIYDDIIGQLENPTENDDDDEDDGLGVKDIIGYLLIIGIIIFLVANRNNGGGSGGFSGGGYSGGSSYSGGFSSGRSSGGYSGGGGSFGGGGASGKF